MSKKERVYRPGRALPENAGKPGEPSEEVKSAPFPLHCFPPAITEMGKAICQVERTPESLVGCCLLGILSTSIGTGLQVRSGPSRLTRANLYIMPSGESGSGKSETYRHVAQPFREFEDALLEKWQREIMPGLLAEKELLENEILALKKNKANGPVEREDARKELEHKRRALLEIESRLQAPVLSVEDITSQALAVSLAARNECLASLSADAGEVINNLLGRYNKLDRSDDGLYVKAWTGDRFLQDRIGRPPVKLRRPCLSALWLVQPDKVQTILSEQTLVSGGAIPRLLICHTNCRPRLIEDGTPALPAEIAEAYRALIWELLEAFRLAGEPVTVEPMPEALRALNEHYNSIVVRWHAGELRDVTSYALRWTEQAWRIAVCLHAGTNGKLAGERLLSLETALAAIEIAGWFSAQQLEILSAGRRAAKEEKLTAILEMLVDCPTGVTARNVQRALHLATAEETRFLLEEMESNGDLESEDLSTGGRPHRLYRRSGGERNRQFLP